MEELANVWPRGGLFAFSGVDGETRHNEPFVAAGSRDGIGWRFWLKPRVSVEAYLGAQRLIPIRHPDDFVFSDCWHCSTEAEGLAGAVRGAFLDHASMAIRMEFAEAPSGAFPNLEASAGTDGNEDVSVFHGEDAWLALRRGSCAAARSFGIACSYASASEAIERANRACAAALETAIEQRLAFYRGAAVPQRLVGNNRRAFYKAVSIQKVNIESAQDDIPCRWTTPDRMPHRHMWMWDSAFHAVGLQHVRLDLAQDAIRALIAKQRPDGKLSLAAEPGPPPKESEDTQPPIVAWSVYMQAEDHPDLAFLQECYPSLLRYVEWFETNRQRKDGLYGWRVRVDADPVRAARGGESGMDNSPRFEGISAMTAVDLSSYMANEYRCLAKIARWLDKGDDAREWHARWERIAERVNALLWDDEDQFYYDIDSEGEVIRVKTTAGFMPLLARIPDNDRAEALRMHLTHPKEFWSSVPVASVSQDEPAFCQDMWRGPMWPNVNVLIYHGLCGYGGTQEARALANATLREITRLYAAHGCFYEFYDSTGRLSPPELPRKGAPGEKGGVGFGVVEDLHWTAAAFVHLANELR